MMQIFINDHETTCKENSTLKDILLAHDIPPLNIAIAVNNTVIPKVQWDTTPIQNGNKIIIIKAVQGG